MKRRPDPLLLSGLVIFAVIVGIAAADWLGPVSAVAR